ncbi:MAG: hypothetical protein KF855_17085 [Acidobacteria bacterium]|nr:hypothetical protein [Acidobacteriota bacterium]
MEKVTHDPTEIPTALPGVEDDDDVREKLLLEDSSDELEDVAEEEGLDDEEQAAKPNTRRWQVVRTFAAFAVFLCLMVVGIAWFFGMGWFSKPQTKAVNRSANQEAQTSPVTEDEKLRMALSMVALPPTASVNALQPDDLRPDENGIEITGDPYLEADTGNVSPTTGYDQDRNIPIGEQTSYSLPPASETSPNKGAPSNHSQSAGPESETRNLSSVNNSDGARGQSLFFGISKKSAKEDVISKPEVLDAAKAEIPGPVSPAQIPFGTLLPVRLVGSIYTLRNSGGFVRMELMRSVEGKGYSYPAGTLVIGNVRGGESVRAFVNIVGLIDPVSGDLIRFSGELLGSDGGSGIEGKRRNLTSQWARFFRGLKETAGSVLGSVGAIRSGSTVILSEPIRRGTESMSGDLSDAILKNDRENTFLEVAAGSSGYVLVTGLPENAPTATANRPTQEATKE